MRVMKKEFSILRERPRLVVRLTRDSVCAGDDVDAPHAKVVETYSFLDPEALVRELASGFLPTVHGSDHTWTCSLNGQEIAQIENAGIRPLVSAIEYEEENRAHFSYRC